MKKIDRYILKKFLLNDVLIILPKPDKEIIDNTDIIMKEKTSAITIFKLIEGIIKPNVLYIVGI